MTTVPSALTHRPTTFVADETSMYGVPLVVERMNGLFVWVSGDPQPYLDLVQGYSTTLLGHCHPVVVESVIRNVKRVDLVHSFATTDRGRLAELLAGCAPVEDARVHFTVGGAEAVGYALRIARWVTGREIVACLPGSFHGLNGDILPTSRGYIRRELEHLTYGAAIELTPGDTSAIEVIRSGSFAALIVEPVQAAAGWRRVNTSWLREIAAACRTSKTLLIADEIQCGLGRCGALFMSAELALQPDILLLGKAIAGGAYPLGVMCVNGAISDALPRTGFGIGSTFSNSALGCAIALDVMQYISEMGMITTVAARGERLARSLASVLRAPGLAGVRNVGLGIAIDFATADDARRFVTAALHEHIFAYAAGVERTVVKLSPPLNITDEEIDFVTMRLGSVARSCEKEA